MTIELNCEYGRAMIDERLDKFRANISACMKFKLHIHSMSDDTVAHLREIQSERTIKNKCHRKVLVKFGKMFDENNLKILKQALDDKKNSLLDGMDFVCTVAKANNLYDILTSFEGHSIESIDCYESHLTLIKPSVTPNIKKLRLRIKGNNTPIKEYPHNLVPLSK